MSIEQIKQSLKTENIKAVLEENLRFIRTQEFKKLPEKAKVNIINSNKLLRSYLIENE